jgi:hypothetical protein
MANLDLRPLSLGEILDRTFSLYRNNFLLFVGIAAVPQLLILALNFVQTFAEGVGTGPGRVGAASRLPYWQSGGLIALVTVGVIVALFVYVVAYLFAQGGTVYAVSELYLGRTTTIGASLGRMRGQLGSLFGVTLLNGLVVGIATLLFIIPGIYMACRLITCVPAALLENLGPRDSLERSFRLTGGSAGRSFLIYFLYLILIFTATFLFMFPVTIAVAASANNPEMMRVWLVCEDLGGFLAKVLVTPILTIATAVFYYDLRVRKEAFDLQLMMAPGATVPSGTSTVPTMFS